MRDSFADMTLDELVAKRDEIRKELFQLRIDKVVGHVSNPLRKRTARRALARVHTRILEALNVMETKK